MSNVDIARHQISSPCGTSTRRNRMAREDRKNENEVCERSLHGTVPSRIRDVVYQDQAMRKIENFCTMTLKDSAIC